VNIYGSREMFVSEYRSLLADRLLQSLNYDMSREVCAIEVAPFQEHRTSVGIHLHHEVLGWSLVYQAIFSNGVDKGGLGGAAAPPVFEVHPI